jgi:antirestriction protein ArdC
MSNAYETITARLIAQLESGVVPWRQPWKNTSRGSYLPCNFATGKTYRGINMVMLLCSPFASTQWMTYKQAQERGAQVRKGQAGTPVVFWQFEKDDATDRKRAWCKGYTVFNVEQMDGIPQELPFDSPVFDPLESAQKIADSYMDAGGPALLHGGSSACYMPSRDAVYMPEPTQFTTRETYYSTLFHEFGHSTGAVKRLNRKFGKHFGDADYAREELVAEFTAAFLSAESGVVSADLDAHNAAYISNWLTSFKADARLAVTAAQRAQKAADLIMGRAVAAESPQVPETFEVAA